MYPDEEELSANMVAYLDTIIQQPQQRPQMQPLEQLMVRVRVLFIVLATFQLFPNGISKYRIYLYSLVSSLSF
jgi:hypothetical protein